MTIDCTMEQIIGLLNLEPSFKSTHELRFGKKGSLSVSLAQNSWYDFEHQTGGGMLDFIVHHGKAKDRASAAQWLMENGLIAPSGPVQKTKPIERAHIYRDESGTPIKKSIKFTDGSWRQMGWYDGQWRSKVKGLRDIPYQLDQLAADTSDGILFIFEGEKDVDSAVSLGLLATCNAGGAGNWRPALNQFVKERMICVVPDNDSVGFEHATKLLHGFDKDGIEAFMLTSYLDGLKDKGDFSDWLELEGNTIETFISLAEADLANKKPPEQAYLEKFGIKPASALFDMHFEPLRFLYDGLIPAVGLTLLAALPKVGKSWFVLNLARHIDADGIPVHYLAAEDNERRLKDRVQAVFSGYVQHPTYHAVMSTEEKLPRGAAALSHIELVAKGTKAQCIVIDTVQSILMPSANNKNYDQTVEEYDGLRKLAHKLGIAIVVVHHCKKTSDVSSAPLEKVIGSIGITGTAETILVMEQQTGTKDCKLYVTGKDVEQCEKYLSWNGHGFDIGDDVREAQLGATQKLVLELIRESPRCMQKHIVDTIGKDQGQVARAIDRLIEVGLVVKKESRLMAQ